MTGNTWRIGLLVALTAAPLEAQSLAERVRRAPEGTVRLSFASRPGVCGSGSHSITISHNHSDGEWEGDCERGPVRVSMRLRAGRVEEAETYVGGRWRAVGGTDLGLVPAREAAELLLALAPAATGEDGGHLITAAALADSAVVWPRLLEIARDTGVGEETRRQAVFWVGQAAGDASVKGLDSLVGDSRSDGDIEVRKHAVFALSQRPADEGVPVLIRIARTNRHPELRRMALFWLGQSEDPRALSLFEELLATP